MRLHALSTEANLTEERAGPLVSIAWMKVAADFPFAALRSLLDEEEQARAARFRFAEDRDAFAAAHALLRHELGRVGGGKSWRFETLEGGKPVLAGAAAGHLHFSLSHSRGMAAVAVTAVAPVGVDVEAVGRSFRGEGLCDMVLAPSERAVLDSTADEAAWRDAFFSFWTLKEAVIKATGQGLTANLKGFALALAPPRLATTAPDGSPAAAWRLHAQLLGTHRLAAALRAPEAEGEIFRGREVTPADLLAAR